MDDASGQWNRRLIRICAVLIAIDLLHIPLGLASIPRYLERVGTLTIPVFGSGAINLLTNASAAAEAEARGMTMPGFAWYSLAVQLAAAAVFTGVGGLVLLRARAHWFGWFTAHVMLFLNGYAFFPLLQAALLVPAPVIEFSSILWPTVLLYFFLFPNGRVVPGWMRLPILVYAGLHFTMQFAGLLVIAGAIPGENFEPLVAAAGALIAGMFIAILVSQIFRYLRVSAGVERAQTRWFILAIVVLVVLPEIGGLAGFGPVFLTFEWELLSLTLIPITLAIAILRYRLWDIDVIIRKTLQYTLVTGLLAMIYFTGIVLLQGVVGPLTGDVDSPLVTVITTLGIAALFNPVRSRVQNFLDRRFYRQKYDAELALAGFARTARDEVDLDRLTEALFRVIEDTMTPVKVSSWIKGMKK